MEHQPDRTPLKDRVLERIREKRVSMRPRSYFTFENFLAGFVALVILVVSVAILNFIFFGLRVNGHESLLSFGPRGLMAFFAVFPWPLLALDVLLVLFLETLLRRYKFGYRSPTLYLLIGLLAVAIVGGLAIDRATDVNDRLLHTADHGGLPTPFGDLYEHVRVPAPHDHGIFRGAITSIATSSITMHHDDLDGDTDETQYSVILPPGFPTGSLSVGERIYVAGTQIATATIQAFGVHPLPPETSSFPEP